MNCPNCGELINEGQKFCAKCGTPAPTPVASVFCPNCGTKVEGGAFCPACGTPVQASAPAQPAYTAPAQPAYAAPAQPTYAAPAQPAYAAPAQQTPHPGYRSLSAVVVGPLASLAMILMFVSGFWSVSSWYYSYYYSYSYSYSSSFFVYSPVFAILACTFLVLPIIMSLVRLGSRSRKLGWVGFAFTLASLLSVLTGVLIVNSSHSRIELEWAFYVVIFALVSIAVMCIFDGLKKPLIKIGK